MNGFWPTNWVLMLLKQNLYFKIGLAHKLNNTVTQPDLKINHAKIKQVYKATLLGVELDDQLS